VCCRALNQKPQFPLTETLSNRDLKKKMSPTNAKALNTMRQRVKKHNSSEEFGQLVQKYRWVWAVRLVAQGLGEWGGSACV
jgi:hypothetical protein